MNISEALLASAQTELVIPPSIDKLPALAYEKAGDSNAHEALQKYAAMPRIYEYATWVCIENIRNSLVASGMGVTNHAREKYMSSGSAAVAGTASMVRYLSLLPYVYAEQRKNFDNAPEQIDEQVTELADIANDSVGDIVTMAKQNIGVSGVLERDGYLRSRRMQQRQPESGDANHGYTLQLGTKGLFIRSRFSVEGRISAIERNWQQDHQDQKMRKVGCVALRLTDKQTGVSLFETMWQNLVILATTDERFYHQDLLDIKEMHEEYDY